MLKPAIRHAIEGVLVALGLGVAFGVAVAWRLSIGPLAVPGLGLATEQWLLREVPGGHAHVRGATIQWYPTAHSLGLVLADVEVHDPSGRKILGAERASAAIALDSALLLAPAPGRLTASNFFLVLSVSPEGRYALGYDAHGKPNKIEGLDRLFLDLTGPARRGHPASYLRELSVTQGTVILRQVGAPLNWQGQVQQIVLTRQNGRLHADCRMTLQQPRRLSHFNLVADGLVGLRDAKVDLQLDDLNPAALFPSVGFTKPLSSLDAPVRGHAILEYKASQGVVAADLAFQASAGRVVFGRTVQPFDTASVTARYNPRSGVVALEQLLVSADATKLNLAGQLIMVPEAGPKRPVKLVFELRGPGGQATLAASAAPQSIENVKIEGTLIPDLGLLDITSANLILAGAPISGKATLTRGTKDGMSVGLKAEARVLGPVEPEQVFAFWPESLGRETRDWLKAALQRGRATGVTFTANVPPGAFDLGHLENGMLTLIFDVTALDLAIGEDLPSITDGEGRGVLQGNRIDLTLARGQMEGIALSEGSAHLPRFFPAGAMSIFRVRGTGDSDKVLAIVDRPPWRIVSGSGFAPDRVRGRADVQFEMTRLMSHAPQFSDIQFRYWGQVLGAEVRDAALGLTLNAPSIHFTGTKSGFEAQGPARVGPYRGDVGFKADWASPLAQQVVTLDGQFDLIGQRSGAPLKGRILHDATGGRGEIDSTLFSGSLAWSEGQRVRATGTSSRAGVKAAGLPAGTTLPDRFPVQLTLDHRGDGWTGALSADAFSGSIVWRDGQIHQLQFSGDLTPEQARRVGFPSIPLFDRRQTLVVNSEFGPGGGEAHYEVGSQDGEVSWRALPDDALAIRWSTELDRKDLDSLGVPKAINPLRPIGVEATFTSRRGGAQGEVTLAGAPLKFGLSPEINGRRQLSLSGRPTDAALERLGLLPEGSLNGSSVFGLRVDTGQDHWKGRADLDLSAMAVSLRAANWRKPAGRAALAVAEISGGPGWLTLDRLSLTGPQLNVLGTVTFRDGMLTGLATRDFRIEGLVEGSLTASPDPDGVLKVIATGPIADARPLLSALANAGPSADVPPGNGIRLNAQFQSLRLSDRGLLREARLTGLWQGPLSDLSLSAKSEIGSQIEARSFPEQGRVAFTATIGDVGDVAQSILGLQSLHGGGAQIRGHITDGGADAVIAISKVTVTGVNSLAQILTLGSFRGLADTLNGKGIQFTHIDAPLRLRSRTLLFDEVNATGPAMGISARGVVDLDAGTMDLSGAIAPSYGLNAMLGSVPGVGQLLASHKGEGLVALTYSAKGPYEAPKIVVNPLALAAPGILRRLFEPVRPLAAPATEVVAPGVR